MAAVPPWHDDREVVGDPRCGQGELPALRERQRGCRGARGSVRRNPACKLQPAFRLSQRWRRHGRGRECKSQQRGEHGPRHDVCREFWLESGLVARLLDARLDARGSATKTVVGCQWSWPCLPEAQAVARVGGEIERARTAVSLSGLMRGDAQEREHNVTIMRTTLLVAALVGLVATGDVAFDVADFIKAGDGASAALHRGSL